MRYDVVTEVAGGNFATKTRLAEIEADLAAVGAHDLSLEIVSGVLVGIGFSIDAENVDKAESRAEEILWATSLEKVGPLKIGALATA